MDLYEPEPYQPAEPVPGGNGWLDNLPGHWQWDELAAEVNQESQARVVLAGPPGAGKSLLFNRLRGWVISYSEPNEPDGRLHLEFYGSFILADLPADEWAAQWSGDELLPALGDPALFVYTLDAAGVSQVDYRWISLLRATGKPVLVVLNKCDLIDDVNTAVAEARRRLAMPVVPISAATGLNVETLFLPALLDAAPRLAVTLGREIVSLRRAASCRVMRQVALLAGMMGAQPIPLLDLPFQALLQVGMVMRIGAAFGYPPSGGVNREVVGTVIGTLGLRYLSASLLKFVPLLGWAVGGLFSATATMLLGEAAIRYYEAGATVPLRQYLVNGRDWLWRGVSRGKGERG